MTHRTPGMFPTWSLVSAKPFDRPQACLLFPAELTPSELREKMQSPQDSRVSHGKTEIPSVNDIACGIDDHEDIVLLLQTASRGRNIFEYRPIASATNLTPPPANWEELARSEHAVTMIAYSDIFLAQAYGQEGDRMNYYQMERLLSTSMFCRADFIRLLSRGATGPIPQD